MRLTLRTDLAVRVLMFCAVNDSLLVRTGDIAEACDASSHHLARVVRELQSLGLLRTLRGRSGGMALLGAPEDISIGAVFRHFETETPLGDCNSADGGGCPLHGHCRLQHFVARAVEAFYRELDQVTLADLISDNCGLADLLRYAPNLPQDCSRTRH